ncbi:MAG: hypothetical protein ACLUGY_21400 [Phocaeicola massiliensis]
MKTDEAYSILDIINEDYGVILTKGGNVCMSFIWKNLNAIPFREEDRRA